MLILNTHYLDIKLFNGASAGMPFILLREEFKPTEEDSKLNLEVIKKLEKEATKKKKIISNLYLSVIYF